MRNAIQWNHLKDPDKGLCNNYLEGGGVGKPEGGGHRGKSQPERGGLDVNFNTYNGGGGGGGGGKLVFALFFTNQKSGRRAIRVEIFISAHV